MKLTYLIGLGAFAVSACTSPPAPPPPLQGELIFNKFGEPEDCTQGVYIPGAQEERQCLPPPPEECEPNDVAATAAINPCYPYRNPNDDGGRDDYVPGQTNPRYN